MWVLRNRRSTEAAGAAAPYTVTEDIVLLFAYHFPPENAVGAARPYRFSKYLRRLGYRVHVISASDPAGHPEPDTTYLPDPFLAKPRSGLGWAMEWTLRKFFIPGFLGTWWSRNAARAGRDVVRANPRARITVVSTFPPLGVHLAAWQLAAAERLPWIADFRDPLGDNPSYVGFTAFQRRIYRRLERAVIERADLVIANTDAVADFWQERYPRQRGKVRLIWNGFDPDERLRPLPPTPGRGYKLISHVGSLYGDRHATAILHTVGRLMDAGRISPGSIRIRQVGHADPRCMPGPEFVQRAQERGWLELNGPVSRDRAREIIEDSDGLLLVLPHSTTQVSAKLYEYLQTGKPVLAFIPKASPVARILAQSGVPYRCAWGDGDQQQIENAVIEFLNLDSNGTGPSAWFEEQFNGQKQTEALHCLIQSLPPLAAASVAGR